MSKHKHEVIRPNIFYATFTQFATLALYLGISFVIYRLFVWILDFEVIPYIIETLRMVEFGYLDLLIDYTVDTIHSWIIILITPIILFLLNLVNLKVELEEDKIIVKKGFIKITQEEFMLNEIIRYESEKDFGFFPSGSIKIFTMYGDKIKLDYVIKLNHATKYLDKLIEKNRQKTKEMHQQNIISNKNKENKKIKNLST
ncbi:hypothetical protein GOV08_04345 [Candidatus Woesearchaeota archaeon]|nr:hypothetical protein [Candidatus Woesearchaeota archaeon]